MSQAIGNINIDEAENDYATLINPTLEIIDVYVECLFTDENGQLHSRMILLEADKEAKLIKDAIGLNKLLKQFK